METYNGIQFLTDFWRERYFREIYIEIFRQCDIMDCLKEARPKIMKEISDRLDTVTEQGKSGGYLLRTNSLLWSRRFRKRKGRLCQRRTTP